MNRFRLSRRTLLKGAGAAVALPALEVMLNSTGTAYAQGAPLPRRFATFFFGNGVILSRWVPTATGASWELSSEMAPLANVKPYINVVTGYNVKTPDLRGHHNGAAAMLSAAPFIPIPAGNANYASKFGAKSIDQVAADLIGQQTTFPSIQMQVSKRATGAEGPTLKYISHRGPDQPLPNVTNPVLLFNTLFGNFTPKTTTDPRDQLRVSVLDAVNEDAKRLRARLGAADRMRLDAHLTSIAEVRQRILALPPAVTSSCKVPANPTTQNKDVNGVEPFEDVSKAFADLLALAWACDLTRVASIQFSGSVGSQVFANLGHTDNEHNLTHDSGKQNQVHDAVVFTVRCFAHFLERLKATPEGTGNVLDNSCLLMTSDVSDGLRHSIRDMPIVVAGRGGGFLKYPGVHHRSTSGENTSDVLLTCMRAVGTGLTSVGKDSGVSTNPCRAIEA